MEFLKFIKIPGKCKKILGKHNVVTLYVLFPLCFNFKTNVKQQTMSEHESEQGRW